MDESTSHARPEDGIENTSDSIGRWWVYLAVAVGGTWLFWLPAIALGLQFDSAVGLVLLLVGLAVPGVAGIAFVYLVYDERGQADFWNRVVNPRRVGLRWLVVILLYPWVSAFSPASRISSSAEPGWRGAKASPNSA
ncbi:hypothetical protein ACFQL0_19810 [Haloplanus litoreus]|uniref:hypothetical protein n=1 Tax=Haloplanus litoreus TaxID=767515 RepID=UPI003607D24C